MSLKKKEKEGQRDFEDLLYRPLVVSVPSFLSQP